MVSPSFAAAGAFPEVHEQAMRRLVEVTGLVPVEFPTTRAVGATPAARAADLNAAFADPTIRGILAVVGGEDQIMVIGHLDADLALADPKPFLGTSDNTNLHHWLWGLGIASFYGGTGLLIVVSVCLDLVQKIDSHLVMRNKPGLLETESR